MQKSNDYVVAAYAGDWAGIKQLREEDIRRLTHINYAFGIINDGRVTCANMKNLAEVERIKSINSDVKVLLSVGGWGAGGFSEAASTEEGRLQFAESTIEIINNYGFDGVDVDWEYPCSQAGGIDASPEDKTNFTVLLKTLRKMLDIEGEKKGRYYLLTIAVGVSTSYINNTEMDKVQEYLDFVNLMTYDLRGFEKVTGHHTNLFPPANEPYGLSVDHGVKMFVQAGVPAEKIVIGGAFYGRVWSDVQNANHGLSQPAETTGATAYTYSQILDLCTEGNGFRRYWDNVAKAPYLFDGQTFISYDDEESLKGKARYLKEKGLKGIMFWEYSQDQSGSLVNALFNELK